MREKKYIDRIYQEKFKDFEASPREEVWRSISAKLKEDKKRRPVITPFWSRMAGIAAILTLILLIGEWMFPVQSNPAVADRDTEKTFRNDIFEDSAGEVIASEEVKISEEPVDIVLKKGKKQRPLETGKTSELTSAEIVSSTKGKAGKEPVTSAKIDLKQPEKSQINKRSLFEELAKQNNDLAVVEKQPNFEISTHAAPIYYGNFGKGSFLDPQFNSNSGESEITYSYGINIAYAISDKIKIRSGVSKVNMSYNTNGVSYTAIIGPVPITGMDVQAIAENTEITQSAALAEGEMARTTANRATAGNLAPGSLNQEMGFIEVPVELEYNLIDNRFELNVIGGASTLFLDQNNIYVQTGDITATGKANNLNQISFSTNIGLGLDYNLSDKFKLNFEPMLKYQLNTFNSVSADTQPYYFGIYSGFSFKF
ncbi:MAG: hypothetical protein WBL27_02285 [Salinimicrobium sp.]